MNETPDIPYKEEAFILNGNLEVRVRGRFTNIEVEAELIEEEIVIGEDAQDYQDAKDDW